MHTATTALALALTSACTGASFAGATTYSDRTTFEAAFGGLTLEDFEGIAPPGGSVAAPTFTDFTVESGTDFGMSYGVTDASIAPSAVLFQFNADDRLIFTFGVPVNAVGFQLSSVDFFDAFQSGDALIRAFDGSSNELLNVTIGTNSAFSMSTFFGVSSGTPIARLEVGDAPGFAGYVMMDDMLYGVPAPGGAALALLGGGVCQLRRRR